MFCTVRPTRPKCYQSVGTMRIDFRVLSCDHEGLLNKAVRQSIFVARSPMMMMTGVSRTVHLAFEDVDRQGKKRGRITLKRDTARGILSRQKRGRANLHSNLSAATSCRNEIRRLRNRWTMRLENN